MLRNDHATAGIDIAGLSVQDAMDKAGINWNVEKRAIYVPTVDQPLGARIPGAHKFLATVRDDTDEMLGVVGPGYEIVQNRQLFSFLDDLQTLDKIDLTRAGCDAGGKRVWMEAKVRDVQDDSDDGFGGYLVAIAGHGGASSVWIMFNRMRFACWNQMPGLYNNAQDIKRITHKKGAKAELEYAIDRIDLARRDFTKEVAELKELREVTVRPERVLHALDVIFDRSAEPNGDPGPRPRAVEKTIHSILESPGSEHHTRDGSMTAYGLLQGVTHYIDHVRAPKATADARQAFSWSNEARMIRSRAMGQCRALKAGDALHTPSPKAEAMREAQSLADAFGMSVILETGETSK